MIDKIASAYGRNDEVPNIELAEELCKTENIEGIKEIVAGVHNKDKKIANDCIKVLYEIGERKPFLISDYCSDFIELLSSKNNRLVWGAMTALSCITDMEGEKIFRNLEIVLNAYEQGSVITVDNSMTVLAKLCNVSPTYSERVFPILLEHLRTCRPKEVPQHSERISICVNETNMAEFISILETRKEYLSDPQTKRINKIEKNLLKK